MSVSPDNTAKPGAFTKKVWHTLSVQAALKKQGQHSWLFDGRKIAWSRNKVTEIRLQIDMDAEKGRVPRADKPRNIVFIIIKRTTVIRLEALRAYLEGKMGWDEHVLECMNFFDHLVRQFPSEEMVSIKRNFYDGSGKAKKALLNPMFRTVEAIKGIYASIRTNSSMRSGGLGVSINVDVANTAFWYTHRTLYELAISYLKSCKREWNHIHEHEFTRMLKPAPFVDAVTGRKVPGQSEAFKMLRRLTKLTFYVRHRGKMNDGGKVYKIKDFIWDSKYGFDGCHSKNYMFEKQGRKISICDYFLERYNIRLDGWEMPLVQTTRDGVFPMETIMPHPFQKYNWKLDGDQTSEMIKFAVTRPKERANDIMACIKSLRWFDDPYLKEYGLQIKGQMEGVRARVILNPDVGFQTSTRKPGVSGRWDLREQVFAGPNPRPLNAWAVVSVGGCVDQATVKNFVSTFVGTYKRHGGNIKNATPRIYNMALSRTGQVGDDMVRIYEDVGGHYKQSPDLIIYVIGNKDTVLYERIKKSMDIRFGTLSQVLLAHHVKKANTQYCSNVAMKVNAKLGGHTSTLKNAFESFKFPTMIIGVDVTHGSSGQTGTPQASLAAITMSMDKDCITYAASAETNGFRKEVMDPDTVRKIFKPMVLRWCQKMRVSPAEVFYFRDGVSEGEMQHVLDQELDEVRKCINEVGRANCKMTAIVGTKRHHIRFFPAGPKDGDKNSNPLPGTVVETEVTHPFHYDFYLCSHVAIQGTARPVHYHVLLDEIKWAPDRLQTMIYHHCYQYVRSTTPVSIHPAIYYAHLAAARSRAWEDINASDKDKQLQRQQIVLPLSKHNDNATVSSLNRMQSEPPVPLMPIGGDEDYARTNNIEFFKGTMWFI